MLLSQPPTLEDIQDAQSLTGSIVRKTPIITSNYFNELLNRMCCELEGSTCRYCDGKKRF